MALGLVLMGVTGSGKTTIGNLLSAKLGWPFLDGDDFHPDANVQKMARGIPLTDEDREPWLRRLSDEIEALLDAGQSCILGCSALKEEYRSVLGRGRSDVRFAHLRASQQLIAERLTERVHQYMPADLLQSQFDALEEPECALVVDISGTPEDAVRQIRRELGL